jgi:hypothetical protein
VLPHLADLGTASGSDALRRVLNRKRCHIRDLGQGETWPYRILADPGPALVDALLRVLNRAPNPVFRIPAT